MGKAMGYHFLLSEMEYFHKPGYNEIFKNMNINIVKGKYKQLLNISTLYRIFTLMFSG